MLNRTVLPVVVWASLPLASAGQVFVSETDPTCGGEAPCFTTIQAAVDFAAPGNEVSVAAGTYTGVAAVDLGGDVYHQVVMITESLRLQGGYTDDNWLIPDPELNETIIDAEGAGRGISVVGTRDHTVTISGFTIRDGDYSDLGNADGESTVCPRTSADCGGGLLVREVEIHIDSCKFLDNIASATRQYSDGGGALLWRNGPGSTIHNSLFRRNEALTTDGAGGGLWITYGEGLTITESIFDENEAAARGGGFGAFQPRQLISVSKVVVTRNDVNGSEGGGGVEFKLTQPGLLLEIDQAVFDQNETHRLGTALQVVKQGAGLTMVRLDNLLIGSNTTQTNALPNSALDFRTSSGSLEVDIRHATIVDHPLQAAIRGDADENPLTMHVTNTVIRDAAAAFQLAESTGEAILNHTNTWTDTVTALEVVEAGAPTFNGSGAMSGDAMLSGGGFLEPGSPLIDAGVDSGVTVDVEGDLRPAGLAHDIGADEHIEIFEDGFESGDVGAWSSAEP